MRRNKGLNPQAANERDICIGGRNAGIGNDIRKVVVKPKMHPHFGDGRKAPEAARVICASTRYDAIAYRIYVLVARAWSGGHGHVPCIDAADVVEDLGADLVGLKL